MRASAPLLLIMRVLMFVVEALLAWGITYGTDFIDNKQQGQALVTLLFILIPVLPVIYVIIEAHYRRKVDELHNKNLFDEHSLAINQSNDRLNYVTNALEKSNWWQSAIRRLIKEKGEILCGGDKAALAGLRNKSIEQLLLLIPHYFSISKADALDTLNIYFHVRHINEDDTTSLVERSWKGEMTESGMPFRAAKYPTDFNVDKSDRTHPTPMMECYRERKIIRYAERADLSQQTKLMSDDSVQSLLCCPVYLKGGDMDPMLAVITVTSSEQGFFPGSHWILS